MPQPPGRRSSWRTGDGFQMSNRRNRANAASQLFQLRVAAPASVIHWPITSSTTTICGSVLIGLLRHVSSGPDAGSEQNRGEQRTAWRGRIRRSSEVRWQSAAPRASQPFPAQRASSRSRTKCAIRHAIVPPGRGTKCSSSSRFSRGFMRSSSRSSGCTGVEITYFSLAQLPRSMILQRSLQKG